MIKENLKRIRKENRLSQEEIATMIDVTKATVSNWENTNKEIYPPIDKLMKICEICNVSINEIIEEPKIENNEIKIEDIIEELKKLPLEQREAILSIALNQKAILENYSENDAKKISQTALNLSDLLRNARPGVRTLDTLIKSQVLCQLS